MKILVACEYSGTVRDAFAKQGHEVLSCDILPTEAPGNHYQGDVRDVLYENWDMLIAHPECKYLCQSGVQWLHTRPGRWRLMKEGAKFFKLFMDAKHIPKRAIENSEMHPYAIQEIGGVKASQTIQPWMHGVPESKGNDMWLYGLEPIEETNNVKHIYDTLPDKERQKAFYMSPGPERSKLRAKFYQCIADAFAEQWGNPGYQRKQLIMNLQK